MQIWRKVREPIISLFIFVHITAVVLWVCPPFPMYWSILPVFSPYICFLGFWDDWKMFCHPKNWNLYLTADVMLADGREVVWAFPRMETLDYVTRSQKEKYRKWAYEYINEKDYLYACPDACRFIARTVYDGKTPPIMVQLVRHWSWIQPPPGLGEPLPEGESEYMFFTYPVRAKDLK
jgi:hypothetical protein